MNRRIRVATYALAAVLAMSSAAFAQQTPAAPVTAEAAAQSFWPGTYVLFSGAFGAALTIIGAGWGIGRIGATAVESMARQPEVAGQIQTAMIIAAALIEGVTLFALIVCILHPGSF